MTTSSRRLSEISKEKPFKPFPRPRERLHGYLDWLNHVRSFDQYLQADMEHLRQQRSSAWLHHGLTQSLPFLDDDSPRPKLALHDPGPRVYGPRPAEAPRYLYALEVADLLEFTEEDIAAAWVYRTESCGSVEAAAELYALYRLVTGTDDHYAGETAYRWHPEVVALFPGEEEQGPASQTGLVDEAVLDLDAGGAGANLYDLQAVRGLGIDALRQAWDNRPDSFASLEAAAETLAILRALKTESTTKPSYRAMLSHELVIDLSDTLPLENPAAGSLTAPLPSRELELLHADRRTMRAQVSVVRTGQANFREDVITRYGGRCCISGCDISALVEAAHVIPYRGDQSDDVSNGLLLRVDLHRLFDAHLVSINPETLEVVVANSINDPVYRAYHGIRLFSFTPRPRLLFLETHYRAFKALAR
ncbi:HNH endonuclease [Pseudomonas sp. NPDC008258]|uniref:HNH endonuclease n=1 Tax=Pseudomonas sp. NPDC008258 TaxID=3364418 RepID=UPI0036EAAB31